MAPLEPGAPPPCVVLSNSARIHDAVRANFDEMEAATARLQEIEDRLSCLPDGLLDELILRRKRASSALSPAPEAARLTSQSAQVRRQLPLLAQVCRAGFVLSDDDSKHPEVGWAIRALCVPLASGRRAAETERSTLEERGGGASLGWCLKRNARL